jgi:hypothetical protein
VLRLAAALLGLVALAVYLVVAVRRLGYPFTLEWLESNSLVEVRRLLDGHTLYAAPNVAYVPDGYPPLYFAVSAAVASVTGLSYLPLRLVSLASSVLCFAVLGRLVWRETTSASAGIAAAGLLAATYFATDTWFDVARVDSLFLALSIAGLACAHRMRRARGAIATGLLLAAAFLTKQNGLAEGVAVLVVLGCGARRRLALIAAACYVGVLGLSTLILGLVSHGWYVYYVFELMGEHALAPQAFRAFWTAYLLPTLGLCLLGLPLSARRPPAVLLVGSAALAVEGYVALVHSGGTVNDLLPAYLAVALLAGLALGGTARPVPRSSAHAWTRDVRAGVVGALVVTQLVLLILAFTPRRAVPSSADRALGERAVAGLRGIGGQVLVPADPGLAILAGMRPAAHQDATSDVLRAKNHTAIAAFTASAARAIATRQYSAIVQERRSDLGGFPADRGRFYHRCPQPLLLGVPARVFTPVAGVFARPAWLWLPIGDDSCAAAVRAFDNGNPTASGS